MWFTSLHFNEFSYAQMFKMNGSSYAYTTLQCLWSQTEVADFSKNNLIFWVSAPLCIKVTFYAYIVYFSSSSSSKHDIQRYAKIGGEQILPSSPLPLGFISV